jgi:hypothetical protein
MTGSPYVPPFTPGPMTSRSLASPWSVPPELFATGRRPNSDIVMIAVRRANVGESVAKKRSMPASSSAIRVPWALASLAWWSKSP